MSLLHFKRETCPKNLHQTSLSHTQSKQNSKKCGSFVFFDIFVMKKNVLVSEKHDRKASAIARLANVILLKNKARKIVLAFSLGGKHALKICIRQV